MTFFVLVSQAVWLLIGVVLYTEMLSCHSDACANGAWWGSLVVLSVWGLVEAVLAPASLVVILIALANGYAGSGDGPHDT
jgi:hypothetical protein